MRRKAAAAAMVFSAVFVILVWGALGLFRGQVPSGQERPPLRRSPNSSAPATGEVPIQEGAEVQARLTETLQERGDDVEFVLAGEIHGIAPSLTRIPVFIYSIAEVGGEVRPLTPVIRCTADRNGEFKVILAVARKSGPPPEAIFMSIDHPNYMPLDGRIDVSIDPGATDGMMTLRAEIQLEMAVRVSGTVTEQSGRPLAGATIGAFLAKDGRPTVQLGEEAVAGELGEFNLRIQPASEIVLIAWAANYVPASIRLSPTNDTLVSVVLLRGETVAGRVLLGDDPAGEALVEATPAFGSMEVPLGRMRVVWGAEGPALSVQSTACDKDGRFCIEGLLPGPCFIQVRKIREPSPLQGVLATGDREVNAPAADVDIAIGCTLLQLRVRAGGLAAGKVHVEIEGDTGLTTGITDAEGSLTLRALPGGRYLFRVNAIGYEGWTRSVEAGPSGGVTFVDAELVPSPRASPVLLRLKANEGEVIDRIDVSVVKEGESPRPSVMWRTVAGTVNEFPLGTLPPGSYDLVIRPCGVSARGPSMLLDVHAEVEVPDGGGEVVEEFECRRGGRLQVSVKGDDGAIISSPCLVLDSKGAEVPVLFSTAGLGGETLSDSGSTIPGTPSLLQPVLPEGKYVVMCERVGYFPARAEAEVVVGRVSDVVVPLERR